MPIRSRAAAPFVAAAFVLAGLAAGCRPGRPPAPTPDPSSRRSLPAGEIVGFTGRYASHVWLGIPYARPPVGRLRWRAPKPAPRWEGVRQALAFGSPCPQFASPLGGVADAKPGSLVGNEDCLYLNVYAPRMSPEEVPREAGKRLPVMLWIHGGGNTIGSASFYNGGHLAQSERVIVVTTNYRLGPLGWFRHPALRAEGTTPEEASGNFALLDWIRALRWIRENIAAFGGDPGRVTIFGESAGGTDVYMLLLSPLAQGLFQRAIVESGGLHTSTPEEGEHFVDDPVPGAPLSSGEILLRLLVRDRLVADRDAAKVRALVLEPGEIASYLRSKSARELLLAYKGSGRAGMIAMPKVFRDGVVLPREKPLERFASGRYNRVPVVIGTNRDENKLFLFSDPKRVRMLLGLLPRVRDPDHYELSAEYLSAMWKATGADEPARVLSRVQGPTVWVYRFDWDEEPTRLFTDLSRLLGAAHGFEIPFVFGHFDLGRRGNVIFTRSNERGRKTLSAMMMSYWAQFAYAGDPGRGRERRLPRWRPWDDSEPRSPRFLVFDTPEGGGLRMSAEALTRDGVLARIEQDPRLPTRREKCRIYRELAAWSLGITRADYPHVAGGACARYPFDAYPWKD